MDFICLIYLILDFSELTLFMLVCFLCIFVSLSEKKIYMHQRISGLIATLSGLIATLSGLIATLSGLIATLSGLIATKLYFSRG